MSLDVKLQWKEYIRKEKHSWILNTEKLYYLFGRNSELQHKKSLTCRTEINMDIGIQFLGYASETNVQMIKKFHNKVLRGIANEMAVGTGGTAIYT